MRGIRMLRAASLLEAVVASVIFLTVFAASLETVSRLTVSRDDGYACAEADCQAALLLDACRRGELAEETVRRAFGWGSITLRCVPYPDCPSLLEATVTIEIERGRRTVACKHLIEPFSENTSADE